MAVFDSETHVSSHEMDSFDDADLKTPLDPTTPHETSPDTTQTVRGASTLYLHVSPGKSFLTFSLLPFSKRKKIQEAKVFSCFQGMFFSLLGASSVSVQFVGPAFLQVSPQVNSQCCLRRV